MPNKLGFHPRTLSLTARLTIAFTVSCAALISFATIYLYWSLGQTLNQRDKKSLTSIGDSVRTLLSRDDAPKALAFRFRVEWPARTVEKLHVRLLDMHQNAVAESPESLQIFAQLPAGPLGVPRLHRIGDQLYKVQISQIEHGDKLYELQIALDRTNENALLSEYRFRLFSVIGVCIFGCALLSLHIARRGLRPLAEMARTAAHITSSTLDKGMLPHEMPAELAHLATTFNEMFYRLKASFDRQQQFSADIAHELRTPINNISGELQVALGKDRDVGFYKEAIGSCLEECSRISRIIDSLLFLASADNPKTQIAKDRIDLTKELASTVEFYEPIATEKGITFELDVLPELSIFAERTLFQRAIGNILSNAIKKTETPGPIKITATRERDNVRIDIQDSGIGIAAEHLPHLFDRFYRVDASRTAEAGGSGLGLAIVRSIASIHGGEVEIRSQVGLGTLVRLSLPLPV